MENNKYFNYFGFASNLKMSLLEERIGGTAKSSTNARLDNYGFRFNKQNADGSARANIILSEEEDVFGVLYRLDQKYYNTLCKTEPGFTLVKVQVETTNGFEDALTFVANEVTDDIYPESDYLKVIMDGAKERSLPDEYQQFIKCLADE